MEHACMDAAPSIRVFDEIHELQEMLLRAKRGEELLNTAPSSLASPANVLAALGEPRPAVVAARGVAKLSFKFGEKLEKEMKELCIKAKTMTNQARMKWDLQ